MVNRDCPSASDVVVIGGGPAGLAAAIAARRQGLDVLVADLAVPPIDKPCGEGLMPDGVAALRALGVAVPVDQSVPFRGIRFIQDDISVSSAFARGRGLGIRRAVLHNVLVESARDAGVSFCWGRPVTGIAPGSVRIGEDTVHCSWIIAADGQNSRGRKWMNLDAHRTKRLRFGFLRHYAVAPWTDFVEVYWGPDCQIVITPVGESEVCAALATRNPKLRLRPAIDSIPALSARIGRAVALAKEKGALCGLRVLNEIARRRHVTIGDASGSVDSLTGEGVCMAFRQALSLGEAIAADDIGGYVSGHRKISRMPVLMSRVLLAMDRHAGLRRHAMELLAAEPRLFSRLVATHVSANYPGGRAPGLLSLGWHLLTDLTGP